MDFRNYISPFFYHLQQAYLRSQQQQQQQQQYQHQHNLGSKYLLESVLQQQQQQQQQHQPQHEHRKFYQHPLIHPSLAHYGTKKYSNSSNNIINTNDFEKTKDDDDDDDVMTSHNDTKSHVDILPEDEADNDDDCIGVESVGLKTLELRVASEGIVRGALRRFCVTLVCLTVLMLSSKESSQTWHGTRTHPHLSYSHLLYCSQIFDYSQALIFTLFHLLTSFVLQAVSCLQCVSKSYGHLGCGNDVTEKFESFCSGRGSCSINVISMHNLLSGVCPPDLKAYLEVAFICVDVLRLPDQYNDNSQNTFLLSSSSPSPDLPTKFSSSAAKCLTNDLIEFQNDEHKRASSSSLPPSSPATPSFHSSTSISSSVSLDFSRMGYLASHTWYNKLKPSSSSQSSQQPSSPSPSSSSPSLPPPFSSLLICPWLLVASDHQRFKFTLIDFSQPHLITAAPTTTTTTPTFTKQQHDSKNKSCLRYATITEGNHLRRKFAKEPHSDSTDYLNSENRNDDGALGNFPTGRRLDTSLPPDVTTEHHVCRENSREMFVYISRTNRVQALSKYFEPIAKNECLQLPFEMRKRQIAITQSYRKIIPPFYS
ncbi:hypothetical protein HELRODRAFT_175729 [Helobdella robusta]|uniref:SUEL-type lectin domain-containing protein n=1 Tax=Helobdella robusta TaxID=6412 RepID=T1F9L2_HELRO|nr:hypothetical protein HELRODRAFT_175729 [Helobdella robusta]ESO00334.1 hypothetical protein HELRODRAFT_175729 [Helobdella robusta]